MSRHLNPRDAGPYRVIPSYAGTPLVVNDRMGMTKVRIPCKTWERAEEVCRRPNVNEHDGVVHA